MTKTSKRSSRACDWGLAACWLMLSSTASAALLQLTPRIGTGVIHETNPRLNQNDENSATGMRLTGKLEALWSDGVNELQFTPRANFTFYNDSSDRDLEDEDYYLDFGYTHTGQTSEFRTAAGYSNQSIRQSELENPGDSPPGSGNLNQPDDTQRRWSVSPSWTKQLDSVTFLRLNATYIDISFDRKDTGRLPYDLWTGGASLQRYLSSKFAVGIVVDGSNFESRAQTTNLKNSSTTYGGSGFVTYEISDTLSASAYFGARITDITIDRVALIQGPPRICLGVDDQGQPVLGPEYCSESFSDTNLVGSGSLTKQSLNTTYNFILSRAITPNSNGAETIRDSLNFVMKHRLTERSELELGALLLNQEDAASLTKRKRYYMSLNAGWRFNLDRHWSLQTAYRFVNDENDNSETIASNTTEASNQYFFVGIAWQGQPWRW